MKAIVIDIGGTSFRVGIFNEKHKIEKLKKFDTPNFITNPDVPIKKLQKLLIEKTVAVVKEYHKKYDLSLVGLSFPGPITIDGIVHSAPTVWGKSGKNYHLLKNLKAQMPKITWIVANDITAAAERYGQMDRYRDLDYLAIITISSGVGNKVYDIKNHAVILDKMSIGGELGHVQYDLSETAPICECGGKGHIACFSSGRATEKLVKEMAKQQSENFNKSVLKKLVKKTDAITNKQIVKAARQKDEFTLSVIDKVTFSIAYSIGYLSGTIGVNKFIIVGGFALNLGEIYLKSLRSNLKKIEFFNRTPAEIENLVALGVNDDCDCLIGIGLLAERQIKN